MKPEADVREIRELAIKLGMRPLRMSGALKVRAGLTTAPEVFNVVPSEDEYRRWDKA